MFCHFWQKSENSKWPPFLGRGKLFENCEEYISQIPWALSHTVKEIEANFVFSIFGKVAITQSVI